MMIRLDSRVFLLQSITGIWAAIRCNSFMISDHPGGSFFNPLVPPLLGDYRKYLRDTLRLPAGGFLHLASPTVSGEIEELGDTPESSEEPLLHLSHVIPAEAGIQRSQGGLCPPIPATY
jgi:hypothetical protein